MRLTQGKHLYKHEVIKMENKISINNYLNITWASLEAQTGKNRPAMQETWFDPWARKIPWSGEWLPIPVSLPEKSYGWKSLVGSPTDCQESDTTKHMHTLSLKSSQTQFLLLRIL